MPTREKAFDHGLLSPGTAWGGSETSDDDVVDALYAVEAAYLRALVSVGIAPASAVLPEGITLDAADIASRSWEGGNPVIPLIADLKKAAPDAAAWIHKGATSQDILDTALMLVAWRSRALMYERLGDTVADLANLAEEHRGTVAAARTLTQHAVPTTYGLRFATWLTALLDARDALAAVVLPVQLGGAAGTMAALVELGGIDKALAMPAAFARELGLAAPTAPWHTNRAPVLALGNALTGLLDVYGMLGANVATLSRTEIAEFVPLEGGGSSTMPQKKNPVGPVLLRSLSLRAPGLLSTLHVSAASFVDERPDGAWHAEWPALRELLRMAVAGSTTLLTVTDVTVDLDAVARNLALDDLRAEQRSLGGSGGSYTGLSDHFIDAAIERARA